MVLKVAVIGAGLSGLSAIYGLVNSVHDGGKLLVDVYEAKMAIGTLYKSSGAIANYWVGKFPEEIRIIAKNAVEANIKQACIYAGDVCIRISSQSVGKILNQPTLEKEILKYLRKICLTRGINVNYYLGRKINDPLELLQSYDYIIGADGALSKVAEKTVGRLPKDELHKCLEYWVRIQPDDTIRIFFKEYCPKGYIWVMPSNGYVKVGAGIPTSSADELKEILKMFINEHKEYNGEVFYRAGGIVPTPMPLNEVVHTGRIALVGDAGRFVNAATGGGIHLAVLSGYMAGTSLSEKGDFEMFSKWYHKNVKPMLARWYKIKNLLFKLSIDEIALILKEFRPNIWVDRKVNPTQLLVRFAKMVVKHPILIKKIGVDWFV